MERQVPLVGKRLSVLENPFLFVPDQIHQVGGIFAVVDRKSGVKADLVGMVAQQTRADAVEGAGPGQLIRHDGGIVAHDLAGNPLHALRHFGSRPTRECHQQDSPGIGAVDDQMGDAMGEGVGLSGPSPCDHQ